MDIKKFIKQHPDMSFIIMMYAAESQNQFGGSCQFEIALTSEEEGVLIQRYKEQGYSLADANYFGNFKENFSACFMTFISENTSIKKGE